MRRIVSLVLLGVCLLAGCSGESEPGGKATPAPEPPVVRTLDQLSAALPQIEQVPTAAKTLFSCPGESSCQKDTAGSTFELKASISDAELKSRYDKFILPENVDVNAVVFDGPEAAAQSLAKARQDEEAFTGTFSTKGKDESDSSYSFGSKGTGTLDDVTVAGWKGYVGQRVQVLTSPEGGADTPPLAQTTLHLADANTTLKIVVSVLADEQQDRSADAIARQVAEDFIERLG